MTTMTIRLKMSGRKVSTTHENKSMWKTNGDGTDKGFPRRLVESTTRNSCGWGFRLLFLSLWTKSLDGSQHPESRPVTILSFLSPKFEEVTSLHDV